jgi:hypothetical protein
MNQSTSETSNIISAAIAGENNATPSIPVY